jgi:alpha-aminoadipic semialdehyde synthase
MGATLGIRREDKSRWERRAPLAPEHVRELKEQHGITTVIQPSPIRVFTDDEYRDAGALVDEDLSGCDLVIAVKEIPTKLLAPKGRYMYFSHTHKGQPYNMAMLRRLLDLGCTLLDHEKVIDDEGRRLVLFGYHAGLAGMIDSLWSLGQRLELEGHDTPFARIRQAYTYESLTDVEEQLREVSAIIASDGLPAELGPLVVGLAGYGNVSKGAQHILDLLSPRTVEPEGLEGLKPGAIYKVVFKEEHMVAPKGAEPFDLQTYYKHPEHFRPTFSGYLDHLTVLVNCIYWEDRCPRLVTFDDLKRLFAPGNTPRLRVIGDISCDIEGSIQATVEATQPDAPVYVYDPYQGKAIQGFEGRGPVIMAVDTLPCELPREATLSFGAALISLIPGTVSAGFDLSFDELVMPPPMKRAVIVHHGELTPDFRYLEQYLDR